MLLDDDRPTTTHSSSTRSWIASTCVVGLGLAGCMASSTPVVSPDGERLHRIECNYTLDNCHREARELCGVAGYEVVRGGKTGCVDCGASVSNPPAFEGGKRAQADNSTDSSSAVFDGVLVVRCR